MTADRDSAAIVADLLETAGKTYAEQAGIRLRDTPAPLYQLLVLTLLLSARISSDIAVEAARQVFDAGWTTGPALRGAHRRDVIAALGKAHYVRYDEGTATALADAAELLGERYGDDLRRLAANAEYDADKVAAKLQEFKRIGDTGSHIFLREVQDVWDWVGPQFDAKATDGAERLGLPTDPDELGALAPRGRRAALAAALVRAELDDDVVGAVRAAR